MRVEKKSFSSKDFVEITQVLTPPIFYKWFLEKFPDPLAWFNARTAYTRTCAVMSMVGAIVGLGDRHGENILFDGLSGDCVHVDLNCLFWKGLEFQTPERVPFRLTHNMVDAFGVTKIEGIFRSVCEIVLRTLRENRETLLSVLETFILDPLAEWLRKTEGNEAKRMIGKIDSILQGKPNGTVLPLSVEGQVESLIAEATSIDNLSRVCFFSYLIVFVHLRLIYLCF